MNKDEEMEKMTAEDGKTPDLVAGNVEKMRELFPEVFADGQIDFEALKQVLGDYSHDTEEHYSFTWHGKSEARRIAQLPSQGTLRPCPEESVNWDETQNIFIEGDNLEVLKLLQKSYHRKVKMIYIDPPYNTGKEFIYPDRFKDNLDTYLKYTGQTDDEGFKLSANSETGGRHHTNWLNMMYPRLKLARNLLRDDGVIFVSIDDHEVQNIRQLMDEIFGSENFIATAIWQKMYAPKSSAKHLSEDHDYVVIYAQNSGLWRPELLPRTDEQNAVYKNVDDDPRGRWRPNNLAARNFYSKGTYSIRCPGGRVIDGPPSGSYWRISREKFDELDADNRIWWGVDGNNVPAPKIFLSEVKQGRVPQTLWTWKEVGHSQEAKKEMLGRITFASSAGVFDTPKPTRLIQRMLQIGTQKQDSNIVLDFFAGSASTGDAVMQINQDEGSNRKYILVQLPEKTGQNDYETIADIAKARLRAASTALTAPQDSQLPGMEPKSTDLGFKVFKLDSSNIQTWDADYATMDKDLFGAIDNIKTDRSQDDVLYELLLKYGLDLAIPVETRTIHGKTVFIIGAGALVVCLDKEIGLNTVKGIAALKAELTPQIMKVVFKDAGFADDVVKTNTVQILKQAGVDDVKSL